jgi:hypothetical protein
VADISQLAQALAAMVKQPPLPPMLADQGISQNFQGLLKYPDSTPPGTIREINPGMRWGGKDKNAIQPLDVQMDRVYGIPTQTETI